MLSLFTRRVALSAYRSSATYSRILPPSAFVLRDGRILHNSHHTGTVRTFTHPQRNASTKATAKTDEASPPSKSKTADGTQPRKRLSPAQKREKELALKAEKSARTKKKEEAAALQRKRLAEKKKKLAEARVKEMKAKAKNAKEAKKQTIIKPPPRRMNSFSLFVREAGKPLQEAVADWHNLSEEAKQEYVVSAKAVAAKRKEEFDAFAKTVTPTDVIRYNRHRRSKGAFGIRVKFAHRPVHSFMRFLGEFRTRPEQVGKPAIEVSKAGGEAWRSLTQEEKDRYKHYENKPTEPTTA